jgi:hypothetical protein
MRAHLTISECGKMVMGFEKANHEHEKHSGQSLNWMMIR